MNDRARLVDAATRAGAHDRIAALPRGYDTPLTRIFEIGTDNEDSPTGWCSPAGSGSDWRWPAHSCGRGVT